MQVPESGVRKERKGEGMSWEKRIRGWFAPNMVLLMPAIGIILFLSVFPLIVSVFLSFTRLQFVRGGFEINWVGLSHYRKLLFGSEQRHFLGRLTLRGDAPLIERLISPSPLGWALLVIFFGIMLLMFVQYITSNRHSTFGTVMRVITVVFAGALAYLSAVTLTGERGLPGTLVVTLIFVFVGVTIQYLLGLGLAMILTQNLPGRRFFRVVFLLPMMITPVGIGFLFRMLTDTDKGPFSNILYNLGLADFSWVSTGGGARAAVLIGDTWQWTPFVFIILLAALEGIPRETIEAALVDGANRLAMFRRIILPQIIPVSTTVILIRLIEAFKIIDMPSVLTYGGPGTATESVTLHAFTSWRALNLGESAALAYMLLIIVTFVALVFVNIIRRRLLEVL